ncbi:MAG TPA: SAM-dependent chlorinase/fluorinase [Candidatus Binataceae bacterium]|nr:SAM-dependent chlorinase/fluorinase [Candidatus Binataceae bacterium]
MPKAASRNDPIAVLTDFGYRDHYVGVMKGVIASIAPATPVIDLTHGIPPQSIAAGALILAQSWRYFPPRTIFLAVVDPGVGTTRLPIAIATRSGARFVGPDNGLLAIAAEEAGIRAIVELHKPRYRLPITSATFHGRDIFAPAAAWIARGKSLPALGPRVASITPPALEGGVTQAAGVLTGAVIYVDGFGNLVTNLSRERIEAFAGRAPQDRLSIGLGRRPPIRLRGTYGDAPVGTPLALFGSFGTLEIAIRDGHAAGLLSAEVGAVVTVITGR